MKMNIKNPFFIHFSLIQSGQFSPPNNTNCFPSQNLFTQNESSCTYQRVDMSLLYMLNSIKDSVHLVLLINLFISDLLMEEGG